MNDILAGLPLAVQLPLIAIAAALIVPIDTLVHESGHALAIRLLSASPVRIYIGSYGKEETGLHFGGNKVSWIFSRNPLHWNRGMCSRPALATTTGREIMISAAGPLASLLLFALLLSVYLFYKPEGGTGAVLFLACVYTAMTTIYNILPRNEGIRMDSGEFTRNDGASIEQLYNRRKLPAEFQSAEEAFAVGDFAAAMPLLESVLTRGKAPVEVYRLGVACAAQLKQWRNAAAIQRDQMARFPNINLQDRINMALIKIEQGFHADAIVYLKHLLSLYGPDKFNLNNLGYVLNLTGEYAAALEPLGKALELDPEMAFAYNNRGYAYLHIGHLEEARTDIEYALQLDDSNALAHRNLGLYHLRMWQFSTALACFQKAGELDPETPDLRACIAAAREERSGWIRS